MNRVVLALALLASSLSFSPPIHAAEAARQYTVQAGDTLYAVSRKFAVSVAQLRALNGLSSDTVKVGQVLVVAAGTPAGAASATSSGASSAGVVQRLGSVQISAPAKLRPGDAFSLRLRGADANRVTVRFSAEAAEDVRQPGEVLKPLPGSATSGVVLGRVVLGTVSSAVTYEVRLGEEVLVGKVALERPARSRVDQLHVPQSVLDAESEATRRRENDALEAAYALRTPQQWREPFLVPLESVVTSAYGSARVYQAGGKVNYHYGTDLRGKTGTPIRATNRGTVVVADFYATRGGLTVIDHGAGVVSAYFHQSRIGVKVGDQVERGQTIGQVGSTGYSLAPHLHWEMRVRGEATDPWDWAGKLYP